MFFVYFILFSCQHFLLTRTLWAPQSMTASRLQVFDIVFCTHLAAGHLTLWIEPISKLSSHSLTDQLFFCVWFCFHAVTAVKSRGIWRGRGRRGWYVRAMETEERVCLCETWTLFKITHFCKYTYKKCTVYTPQSLKQCTKSYREVLSQNKHCSVTLTENPISHLCTAVPLLFIDDNHQPAFNLSPPLSLRRQLGGYWVWEVSKVSSSTFGPLLSDKSKFTVFSILSVWAGPGQLIKN